MLLKNIYSESFIELLSSILKQIIPNFDHQKFTNEIFGDHWLNKELKQRMKHISFVLSSYLAKDFKLAAEQIILIANYFKQNNLKSYAIELMFLPDYIENYGINEFKNSVKIFEIITELTSCEFAVRPFILKYEKQMMEVMTNWSFHENEHVRRLASEGCRPRLPWSMALPRFKKNPELILPILENLKKDPSEYVRRSVANNLNDITKDNPEIVIEIAKKWKGTNLETNAIVKHAVRTLLKQGNLEILDLYKLKNNKELQILDFEIVTLKIKTNNYFPFSFVVKNNSKLKENVRLEYAIYFLLNNGKHSKKVFKILEKEILPNQEILIERKHNFKIISTRKFYEGEHKISVILNGIERDTKEFILEL